MRACAIPPTAPLGHLHQPLVLGSDLADRDGARGVAVVALVDDAEVEPDDVPVAQLALRATECRARPRR